MRCETRTGPEGLEVWRGANLIGAIVAELDGWRPRWRTEDGEIFIAPRVYREQADALDEVEKRAIVPSFFRCPACDADGTPFVFRSNRRPLGFCPLCKSPDVEPSAPPPEGWAKLTEIFAEYDVVAWKGPVSEEAKARAVRPIRAAVREAHARA